MATRELPLLSTDDSASHMKRRLSMEYGMEAAMSGRRVPLSIDDEHQPGKRRTSAGGLVAGTSGKRRVSVPGISAADDVTTKIDAQTNTEAVFNLLNNCLGTGVLTVSFSFTHVGLFGGWIGLLMSAVLNRLTLLTVVKCCYIADCEVAVATLGDLLFGNAGRLSVIFSYASLCMGVIVAYTNACKSFVSQLLSLIGVDLGTNYVAILVFVSLVPATFLRSMKKVAIVSLLAFLGAIVAIIAVVCRTTTDLIVKGEMGEGIRFWPASASHVFVAMPLLAVVMSAQSGGPVIFASMQDTSEPNRNKVAWIMYAIVFTMNMGLASSVYTRYGANTQGNVLDSFSTFDPCAVTARIGMLILAALSYIFIVFPCRVAFIDVFFRKNEAMQEASYTQFVVVTLFINVVCQLTAYLVSDIALVVGVVGAFSSNMIGFIMPPLFYMMVCSAPKQEGRKPIPMLSMSNLGYWSLLCFGMVSLVLSLYSTLAK